MGIELQGSTACKSVQDTFLGCSCYDEICPPLSHQQLPIGGPLVNSIPGSYFKEREGACMKESRQLHAQPPADTGPIILFNLKTLIFHLFNIITSTNAEFLITYTPPPRTQYVSFTDK